MTAVSVLLPSRRRPALLATCVTSLAATATHPQRVEVLVAADPDDTVTQGFTTATPLSVRVLTTPRRWGRGWLHEYYNWLTGHARGEWVLVFNDDATMQTPGWDQVIAACEPSIALVGSNHGDHMFMAVPTAWAKAAGYLATSPDVDNFLYEAGQRLGRLSCPPVHAFHDQYRVTGRNGDETYWEGRADSERAGEADRADWDRVVSDRERAMQAMTGAIRELAG